MKSAFGTIGGCLLILLASTFSQAIDDDLRSWTSADGKSDVRASQVEKTSTHDVHCRGERLGKKLKEVFEF